MFNMVSFHQVMHAKKESLHMMRVEGMEGFLEQHPHDWDFAEIEWRYFFGKLVFQQVINEAIFWKDT